MIELILFALACLFVLWFTKGAVEVGMRFVRFFGRHPIVGSAIVFSGLAWWAYLLVA